MSVPELTSNISSLEEKIQYSLGMVPILLMIYDRISPRSVQTSQTLIISKKGIDFNWWNALGLYQDLWRLHHYLFVPLQVSVDTSHYAHRTTYNYQVSNTTSDMVCTWYLSFQCYLFQYWPQSSQGSHTCALWYWSSHVKYSNSYTRFVISLSCYLEPDINMPTYWNIFISYDLAPDLSSGLDNCQGIAQLFCEPLLFDSSCHDDKKVDKGRKLRSQLWIRMVGDFIYIFSRYMLILCFVLLTSYKGQIMNNQM